MNTSRSKGLYLSHQAQAASLFLCLMLLGVLPSRPAAAQTPSLFLQAPASPPASLTSFAVSDKPPPFSGRRIAGQIALGTVAGIGAGVVGGLMGVAIEDCHNSSDFLCGLSGAALGISAGLLVGSSVGVCAVGRTETVEIGFGRTLLGSVAGLGTAILLLNGLDAGGEGIGVFIFVVSPAVGATLLGNTSRRYRAGHGPSALLNWNDGQLHLGLPALQQRPLGGVPQTFVRSVRLLEVRW